MSMRVRKLIGTVVLVAFVVAYVVVVVTIGDVRIARASWPVQIAYFCVTGLLWIVPAGLIIRWMQRPDDTA